MSEIEADELYKIGTGTAEMKFLGMEGGSEYVFEDEHRVKIFVHETTETFLRDATGALPGWQAFFHPYPYTAEVDENGEILKIYWQEFVGEIHFIAGRYGSGVVAHECAHAVLQWSNMARLDPQKEQKDNEAFCTELGKMVAQFWTWHYSMLHYITGIS